MKQKPAIVSSLAAKTIAVPESRQLHVLSELFERRGAIVLRVPLISIHDNPDSASVRAWILRFLESPPDIFIVLTGEGLRRLIKFADQEFLLESFLEVLSRVTKVCRGPKPNRVLREYGLSADHLAESPTSRGIINTLEDFNLDGKTVAVQLYGLDPNELLIGYLKSRGMQPITVAPYIYASDEEDEAVAQLLERLLSGCVDAIAFTSQPQFKRLSAVANQAGKLKALIASLNNLCVAVVGPVVKQQLNDAGVIVRVMPEGQFFMKPLVTAMEKEFLKEAGQFKAERQE